MKSLICILLLLSPASVLAERNSVVTLPKSIDVDPNGNHVRCEQSIKRLVLPVLRYSRVPFFKSFQDRRDFIGRPALEPTPRNRQLWGLAQDLAPQIGLERRGAGVALRHEHDDHRH